MPRVSVIVPVYNTEKYLSRCIDSILAQTFEDFELILVDDGSSDNSGRICDEYAQKDKRIKAIHKENGGVSSARNKGLDIAKGYWITFVDSDDWVDVDYLLCFLQHEADLSICGYKQTISFIGNHKPKDGLFYKKEIPIIYNSEFHKMYCRGILSKCFKNSIIKKKHIRFNNKLRIGEDTLFTIQYLSWCQSVRFISEYGYNYACDYYDSKYKMTVVEYKDHIVPLNDAVSQCEINLEGNFSKCRDWLNVCFYHTCLINPLAQESFNDCLSEIKLYKKYKLYRYKPKYNYKENIYFWLSIFFPLIFYKKNRFR